MLRDYVVCACFSFLSNLFKELRIFEPAFEILLLVAFPSNEGKGESVHMRRLTKAYRCSHSLSNDVDETSKPKFIPLTPLDPPARAFIRGFRV